jgi:hypothetical protein
VLDVVFEKLDRGRDFCEYRKKQSPINQSPLVSQVVHCFFREA